MVETFNEKAGEILALVYRRIELLSTLYPNKEYYIGELSREVGKEKGNVSKYVMELEDHRLVQTRKEKGEELKRRPRKYVSLTPESRNILTAYCRLVGPEEVRELSEPDTEEVEFLIRMVNDAPTEEIFEEGLRELEDIFTHTRIWEYEYPTSASIQKEGVWALVNNLLEGKDQAGLKLLITTIRNAVEENEEGVIEKLKKIYVDDLKKWKEEDPSGYRYGILDIMLSDEERWEFYTNRLEKSMREKDNAHYTPSIQPILGRMEGFMRSDRKKCRSWFYKLMSDDDQGVRKRAQLFYRTIRSA